MSDTHTFAADPGAQRELNPQHQAIIWDAAKRRIDAARVAALKAMAERHQRERDEVNAPFDEQLREVAAAVGWHARL